ncbi:LLM class flavin-dependent oxidoreductase [Amycolatopsis endophytica]|uniref:Alkanesulfonate monooxygenase SsuD/methylene tetrahydromethanopterin reductase-like flavin-dependent oxidoreductase (Luciferase family) n=1 Tax=Amycolatopsis endophytica TaxID=860233 RepID=A0A853B620_9PSEU|nr:LLM class flavin-dependent oxidoreductase [Amycolatopsis endophytica]NYI90217.1 alkanesulfonate monooxygenase SsuD/methylene tetrahydromethanopterin reductase-like flavin-dependent oxidoreductase (luciferase family) [Amycolatopsis endophytica]
MVHLAVALDGAGWHPAAWREPDARPDELFHPRYWGDLATEAERGLLDFVTIEDSFGPGPDRTDRVRGRLDAVLIASRVAPLTRHLGFVPTAIATHTEPFHLSKAIATLDYVSQGRAGVRVRIASDPADARHFGRREFPVPLPDLAEEAGDWVEVVRRLWDSWEDDAEIRDAATGRFVDRDKLHYIDFTGRFFGVKGPSITPRPPQGQPPVAVLSHVPEIHRLAARAADLVFLTPHDTGQAGALARELGDLLVFADVEVVLDETEQAARDRRARLDDLAEHSSDALVFTGTPAQLADHLLAWRDAGLSGFRLRPAALPHDLTAITRALVPELQQRGAFRREYESTTLRGLLGLDRPVSRYAGATR